jgi:hypothetical protein
MTPEFEFNTLEAAQETIHWNEIILESSMDAKYFSLASLRCVALKEKIIAKSLTMPRIGALLAVGQRY